VPGGDRTVGPEDVDGLGHGADRHPEPQREIPHGRQPVPVDQASLCDVGSDQISDLSVCRFTHECSRYPVFSVNTSSVFTGCADQMSMAVASARAREMNFGAYSRPPPNTA
jgi:hypothetical protein